MQQDAGRQVWSGPIRADDDLRAQGQGGPVRTLTVVQSVARPRPTTNPYISLLFRHAPADVDMVGFSWRTALFGRYDVLHVHWPELLMRGVDRPRTWARHALCTLLLLRLRLSRTAIVRTAHNVEPHETGSRFERALLTWFDRFTNHWITLTPSSSLPEGSTSTVIPLGHFQEWFSGQEFPASVRGRLVFFGLVRSYKGVLPLIAAFRAWSDPQATLHVLGRPHPPSYGAEVEAAAAGDSRVRLALEHVGDAQLVREIGEAELVVLPYRDMKNSSALLMALSLGRPVLAPVTATTVEIADEVGPGWVITYAPPLTPDVLTAALRGVRDGLRSERPYLEQRNWEGQAEILSGVYHRAAAAARGR